MVLQAQLGILDGRRVVGFLHCTHLHAPSGEPCRVRKQEAPLRGGGGESPPWPAPPLLAKFIHCPSRRESLGGLADQDGVGRGAVAKRSQLKQSDQEGLLQDDGS